MYNLLDKGYWAIAPRLSTLAMKVDLKEITEGDDSGGVFQEVVSATKATGQDAYTLMMIIGGFGGVLLLIAAFIYYAVAGSGNNKDQAKSKILVVILAVAGIFAAVFIVGLAQKLGEGLATTNVGK